MFNILEKISNYIGYGVCHQLPERTFHFGGYALPVCARDTGIYFGFIISFIYLVATHKDRQNEMPRVWIMVIAGLSILAMAVDGVSSYSGLRETTNSIRLLTGLLTGFALPIFIIPIFNYQVWKRSSETRLLEKPGVRIGLLMLIPVTFIFFSINVPWYGYFLPYITAIVVILTFTLINLMILTIIPFWFQKAERWRDLSLPFFLAVIIGGIEIILAAMLHDKMQDIAIWIFNLIY